MADEKTSGIYGKPNFRLIVGLFAVAIVLLLIGGLVFLRFDPLHLRKPHPATGMTLLYEVRLSPRTYQRPGTEVSYLRSADCNR